MLSEVFDCLRIVPQCILPEVRPPYLSRALRPQYPAVRFSLTRKTTPTYNPSAKKRLPIIKTKTIPLTPIVGAIEIVCGIALLIMGIKKG